MIRFAAEKGLDIWKRPYLAALLSTAITVAIVCEECQLARKSYVV
jgi:hypothetical protein